MGSAGRSASWSLCQFVVEENEVVPPGVDDATNRHAPVPGVHLDTGSSELVDAVPNLTGFEGEEETSSAAALRVLVEDELDAVSLDLKSREPAGVFVSPPFMEPEPPVELPSSGAIADEEDGARVPRFVRCFARHRWLALGGWVRVW